MARQTNKILLVEAFGKLLRVLINSMPQKYCFLGAFVYPHFFTCQYLPDWAWNLLISSTLISFALFSPLAGRDSQERQVG
jgi:uncharacterized membrane protein YoaT (DUF817 family)